MSERVRLCATEDVPPGTGREFTVAGRIVALFNVEGTFYAMDGICPHAGGPLGEGELNGSVVTCPWHGWQFDVTTGQHCLTANIVHGTYAVSVENGEVFVVLE
jgi:nitrite reductase/ring-hydroxylating ferredoxin subunit